MNLTKLIGSFNFKKFSKASVLAPTFRQVYGSAARNELLKLFPQDFMTRVADLVAKYGDEAAAAKELKRLIAAEA